MNQPRKPTRRRKRPYVPPTTGRVLAATLGSLPASLLVTACVGRFFPASQPIAFGIAYLAWLPLWLALACWIACRAPATRAWLTSLAITVVAGVLAFAIPH
jgi:hypothetical protein